MSRQSWVWGRRRFHRSTLYKWYVRLKCDTRKGHPHPAPQESESRSFLGSSVAQSLERWTTDPIHSPTWEPQKYLNRPNLWETVSSQFPMHQTTALIDFHIMITANMLSMIPCAINRRLSCLSSHPSISSLLPVTPTTLAKPPFLPNKQHAISIRQ